MAHGHDAAQIDALADTLARAANARAQTTQPSAGGGALTVEDAYAVQCGLIKRCGYHVAGFKMGMTSQAKMRQMNVHEPIFGFMAPSGVLQDGATIPRSAFGQPRVEAELAFILKRPLRWPVTTAEAMAAVGGVCLAIEVLDSRYSEFKFSLPDVIADNTSAVGFVLGSEVRSPNEIDVGNMGIVLEINGKPQAIASSAAVLGHPARSLALLVEMVNRYYDEGTRSQLQLRRQGTEVLDAGTVVLTGGITQAFAVDAGDTVRVAGDGLGEVVLTIGPADERRPGPVYVEN
jgi:2-oxo-3-hexenedioate decarboxylase